MNPSPLPSIFSLERRPIVPAAPSGIWWKAFFDAIFEGIGEEEAILEANRKLSSSKDYARFSLSPSPGTLMTLSLAIDGGSRQLRDKKLMPDLKLSDHGNWRKVHLGAFEAVLGKSPFYRHIESSLQNLYSDPSLSSLQDFNSAIFRIFYSFLMKNILPEDLKKFQDDLSLKERAKELASAITPDTSIIQIYSNLGPETMPGIFGLTPPNR